MLKNFLENIIKQLVEEPESVLVEQRENNDKLSVLVYVHSADLKRVIGREGRVARALQACVLSLQPINHVEVTIDAHHNAA